MKHMLCVECSFLAVLEILSHNGPSIVIPESIKSFDS